MLPGANPRAMAAGWSDAERQLYARRHSSSDQKELTRGRRQPANRSTGKEEVAGRRALSRECRLGGRGNPKAPPEPISPGKVQEVSERSRQEEVSLAELKCVCRSRRTG